VRHSLPSAVTQYVEQYGKRTSAMKNVLCGLVSVGLLLCITGQTQAEFSFTTIDVPNSNFTQAFEINNIGQLVGLACTK
jgi:hypothetical protein